MHTITCTITNGTSDWDYLYVSIDSHMLDQYGLVAAVLTNAQIPDGWKISSISDPQTNEEITQF